VPTKLVDVPGHIFLMVGTGVHERNRLALGIREDLYVIADDEVWIPLEATALGKGFAEAWRVGAESYASWHSRGKLSLVDVARAQARYEPAELPETGAAVRQPDAAALKASLERDAATVASWRNEYMSSRFGGAERPSAVSAQAMNELAHVYFLAGRTDQARAKLDELLGRDPRSVAGLNNLAVVDLTEGEVVGGIERFRLALDIDPSDAGIWLNLGIARYASGDTVGADEPLIEGLRRCGGYVEACRLLGIPVEESVLKGAARKMSYEEARALLKDALRRVPTIGGREAQPTPPAPAERKAPAPEKKAPETRVAAARAGEKLEIQNVLYWKD
jgi:tetratricopeptide (TPR) repeat protein